MHFYQLEQYYKLLDVIERINAKIKCTGSLRASRYDEVHTTGGIPSDRTGDAAIERAELAEKLKSLEQLRDVQRPEVEKTITAAMKAVSVKRRMLVGLVFQSRYINGRDWYDVSEITGVKNPQQLVISTLEKMTGEEKACVKK